MGPDQHAQLDGFGRTFPFPIRVAALMVAGTWIYRTGPGTTTNLYALKVFGDGP